MMQHIGVDIIEIERVAEAIERWGERFLRRVFTPAELAAYRGHTPSLAARFAAKEAVVKALGKTGGITWHDIEILAAADGQPGVTLHGRARKLADELGLAGLAISLSHSRDYAVAVVLGERS